MDWKEFTLTKVLFNTDTSEYLIMVSQPRYFFILDHEVLCQT
jgi:hypothetical protein